jgi:hypothetical protein
MSCTSKSNINRILKVQKKAIRIIIHGNYNDHTAPLFRRLGILPFDKIIEQSKLNFIHSIEFNCALSAFANTWTKNNECNIGHELRNENDYVLPYPRIEFLKKYLSTHFQLPGMLRGILDFIKIGQPLGLHSKINYLRNLTLKTMGPIRLGNCNYN